jgi:hypothetical protein
MNVDMSGERSSKRNYSRAVKSPPSTRRLSADLVKNISKNFDAITGKGVEKSPPKKGKMATSE